VLLVALSAMVSNGWALTIDAQQQLHYADQLFKEQQYRRAAEEYQRFAFFFSDHPQQRSALYKSGRAFLLAGDATTALARFKALSGHSIPDGLAIEADFMMVECYLNLKAPTQAVVQLHNIITLTDDIAIKDRAYHRLGWLYVGFTDWTAARAAFAKVSPANRLAYRTDEVTARLGDTAAIPRKNPALAGTLSILPGAGQLYCNRYEDALIAFVVNVGLFWAASDAFHQDQPALGGLLSFIGLGFYAGNIYGAVSDAHKYNQDQQGRYVDQLKQFQIQEVASPPGASAKGLFFSLHVPF
jgi:tetratricopeptide (TPR) repeat protein